ncbi:MAG: ATP-binding protein [Burkholderiaceae bacterium]|nr:ATP-binding protein [Burkholderiaceae bacterium]
MSALSMATGGRRRSIAVDKSAAPRPACAAAGVRLFYVGEPFAHDLFVSYGDSGCGKRSIVRAGLFAQLERGCMGPGWRTAIALPRRSPLWNVARALTRLAGRSADDTDAVLPWRRALNQGCEAPAALVALRREGACRDSGPGCLLIDQFEELFQHARLDGPAEAQLLAELLMAWQAAPPDGLYLETAMRSEYLGACARCGRLAETVNACQYLLPPMEHADLLRAVREPARLYGGEVMRPLAERLIADAGASQDQLPLMHHTLMRLFEEHGAVASATGDPWRIEPQHFPSDLGCAGLLPTHADEVTARVIAGLPAAPTGGSSRVVEDLFRALTEPNPDGHAIRRPMRLDEQADITDCPLPQLADVIDAFRADGVNFLTPPLAWPLCPETLVDVGHEALIRCWGALAGEQQGWLAREFRNGLVWRSLLVQADSFERDPSNVLGATTTDERERWMKRRNPAWARRYGGGWARVQKLLAASAAARDDERERVRDVERRKRRQRRWFALTGVIVVVAATLLAVSRLEAEQERQAKLAAQKDSERLQQDLALLQATRDSNSDLRAELDAEWERGLRLTEDLGHARHELQVLQLELLQVVRQARTNKPSVSQRLQQAAAQAGSEAGRLNNVAAAATAPVQAATPDKAATGGARLYIQITDAGQRADAQRLAGALARSSIGGKSLAVPGTEFIKVSVRQGALRRFDAQECQIEAPELMALLARLVRSPPIQLEDNSHRYAGSKSIRQRHYELWLPAGDLVLSGR